MSDYPAPVAQNVNPVGQGVQTLSGLLSIQQQRLGIQQQQQGLQGQAAEVQQQQQTAYQRSGIANYMANLDMTKHIAPDGTLDLDGILTDPKLRQASGDQFPDVAQHLIQVKQAQLASKQQLANLNGTLRDQFSSTVGSLRTDPDVVQDNAQGRAKVQQAMGNFAETGGPDAARIANTYAQVANHVAPGKLSQALSTFQMQAMDASTQASHQAPSLVDTGPTLQNTNPQAAGGPINGQPPITKGLAPGAVPVQDAFGRTSLVNPQNASSRPITGSSFAQPVAGQQQVMDSVENARTAGDQAPMLRNINQQLMQLSEDTKTGPGSQAVHKIAAAIGLPSGARYQEITAYLDRQAAAQARTMGVPNTNAGLAASQSATGTTEYSPGALQEKVKFADALNTGAMAYRQGLDKAVGTGATPDLSKYQAWRSAWAQNFDPDVYRAEDAQRRGDKAELSALKQRLGPQAMQALATKSANLRQLENGQIPQ